MRRLCLPFLVSVLNASGALAGDRGEFLEHANSILRARIAVLKEFRNSSVTAMHLPPSWALKCSEVDERDARIGIECETSQGSRFTRVRAPGMGWGWRQSTGTIWLDHEEAGLDQDRASQFCQGRFGQVLPSKEDFETLLAQGGTEILRSLREPAGGGVSKWYWSQSRPSVVAPLGYVFFGRSRSVGIALRTSNYPNVFSRCVAK